MPEEIWRHILSYLALPYTFSVCSYLYTLEQVMNKKRYRNYSARYEYVDNAIETKNWDIVRFLIHNNHKVDDRYHVTRSVGQYGDIYMIQKLINLGFECYSIARGAAIAGHRDIVQWMVDMGARNYYSIAHDGAENGHKDIIRDMVGLGVRNYDWLGNSAARGGHKDIVQWMVDMGARDYSYIADGARRSGHEKLEDWILSLGS